MNRHREPWGLRAWRGENREVGFGGRPEPATVGKTERGLREKPRHVVSMHEWTDHIRQVGWHRRNYSSLSRQMRGTGAFFVPPKSQGLMGRQIPLSRISTVRHKRRPQPHTKEEIP